MKFLLILLLIPISLTLQAQSLIGAWENTKVSEDGTELTSIVIFSKGYQVIAVYETKTGKFVTTNGGSWSLDGNTVTEVPEFNSDQPEKVGKKVIFEIELSDKEMHIVGSDQKFKKLDNGSPGALQGAWLMSGRKRNGEIQSRDTTRSRKTMKILSGTRFQWIAYDTETKEFKGTGGGTYTTLDGKYTENIGFFSKDNSRVGASLEFDFELKDGDWHHSGFSSKGDPIYEIWSLRN